MPLIRGIHPEALAREMRSEFGETAQGTRLPVSLDAVGLELKSILLRRSMEGPLSRIFNRRNEIYMLAFTYDFSGNPPVVYPPKGVGNPRALIKPMKPGQELNFMGDGLALFPPRRISGYLTTHIMLCESDQDVARFGKLLRALATVVEDSELTRLLAQFRLLPWLTPETEQFIRTAAARVLSAWGKILEGNRDDYVDLFEGSFRAWGPQQPSEERHRHEYAEILVEKTVVPVS